ncbi:MAG: pyridoxine 5'-phosphate synthase [Tannerella sp.]|jgi:pyridoxine 5-phosphate synthase|nr:pyridoxine 5'-phosphate synthase [Tannerella sp.]
MTKLSVNINKVATIRNSRGGNIPDVVRIAQDCELFGAQGITVHPRPDERHIRYGDVYEIKSLIKTELNIEGYPSQRFVELVTDVRPAQVTLVPDAPDALTSNRGWDVAANLDKLTGLIELFRSKGIRTSIFVETNPENITCAAKTGTDRIELYTGPYAENYAKDREAAIAPFVEAAKLAGELGLGLNAGHDLSLLNLAWFISQIPSTDEVSIGHALISDALYYGLEKTISMYNNCLNQT